MIQGMAERLGMSIDELVYGRDGIVILTDTEKQRLKANGRKTLTCWTLTKKSCFRFTAPSRWKSVPCARTFCAPTLRLSPILPWMPKRKSKI